ncbi:hypothetical protein ACFLV2_00605 [Chloroflexota bacterium]
MDFSRLQEEYVTPIRQDLTTLISFLLEIRNRLNRNSRDYPEVSKLLDRALSLNGYLNTRILPLMEGVSR